MSYKEITVLFELAADILENEKPITAAKALRKTAEIAERASANPKANSVRPRDLTPQLMRELGK